MAYHALVAYTTTVHLARLRKLKIRSKPQFAKFLARGRPPQPGGRGGRKLLTLEYFHFLSTMVECYRSVLNTYFWFGKKSTTSFGPTSGRRRRERRDLNCSRLLVRKKPCLRTGAPPCRKLIHSRRHHLAFEEISHGIFGLSNVLEYTWEVRTIPESHDCIIAFRHHRCANTLRSVLPPVHAKDKPRLFHERCFRCKHGPDASPLMNWN